MKIYYAAASPYVRKCLVGAHELGLYERIELLPANAHPVNRDRAIVAHNPLGKVPTLITDDGTVLYDSRVIIEYLNDLGDGNLIPDRGPARWNVLVEQALADGMLDAALLARYENVVRPEALRWSDWTAGQLDKITTGLAAIEGRALEFGDRPRDDRLWVRARLPRLSLPDTALARSASQHGSVVRMVRRPRFDGGNAAGVARPRVRQR